MFSLTKLKQNFVFEICVSLTTIIRIIYHSRTHGKNVQNDTHKTHIVEYMSWLLKSYYNDRDKSNILLVGRYTFLCIGWDCCLIPYTIYHKTNTLYTLRVIRNLLADWLFDNLIDANLEILLNIKMNTNNTL